MATTRPSPVPPASQVPVPDPARPLEASLERVLVTPPPAEEDKPLVAPGSPAARLPVELDVAIALRHFRVRNLLALEPGQIIETQWGNGQDVPLAAADVQLAWSEFEVVDSQLAVRLTRLA